MDETTFAVWRVGAVDVVRIHGPLDLPAAIRLRLTLFDRLDAGAVDVVVDLTGVTILDAGSIFVLVQIADRLEHRSGSLTAPGASGVVLQSLEIAGVAKRLDAYEPFDPWLADPASEPTAPAPIAHGLWGDEINGLIAELHALPPGSGARSACRERVIRAGLPFAERLAHRFYGLGEPIGDLNQVAAVGLLRAVDGYNPGYGTDFAAYATPTIVGELKRHFRDRGWTVRVPRRVQELRIEIRRLRNELYHELNRSPTVQDLARRLDVDDEQVVEAMSASSAYQPTSLHAPIGASDGEALTLLDGLGTDEPGYAAVDAHESLQPLLAALPPRTREIMLLRFFGNLTQHEIADRVGLSQMHVSRIISTTLSRMRADLSAGAGA